MNGNIAKIGLASVLILISISVASAATITVNDDGGADYAKIQDAVNNASAGDCIEVWNGTYNENVDVNKRLTIYSRDGAGVTIVEALSSSDYVFEVNADYVNISGFTVKGATGTSNEAGIYLASGVGHSNISYNIATNNNHGIYLYFSSSNTITNNTITNNNCSIKLYHSSSNTITNNTANSNNNQGIELVYSSISNTITNNTFTNNGLFVYDSYGNTIKNNTVNCKPLAYYENTTNFVIQNAGQVVLVNCTNITVKNLNLSNASVGIELWETNDCKIVNNTASNNCDGIYLYYSSSNTIANNTANSNKYNGIYTSHCHNLSFFKPLKP